MEVCAVFPGSVTLRIRPLSVLSVLQGVTPALPWPIVSPANLAPTCFPIRLVQASALNVTTNHITR
jgi:hypothetical protein